MFEDLSPEEKLLRLIKGSGKPDSDNKPAQNIEREQKQDNSPADNKPGPKEVVAAREKPAHKDVLPQQTGEPGTVKEPAGNIEEKPARAKKTVINFEQPVKIVPEQEFKTLKPAPESDVSPGSKPEQQPAQVAEKPQAKSGPEKTDASGFSKKPKTKRFNYGFKLFLSGFNLFNIMLLLVFLGSAGVTLWDFYTRVDEKIDIPSAELPEQEPAKSVSALESEPKPFPYFAEEFTKKNLFRLVAPPPPPPPKEEKKEPEKPKIKIESLTQHLVLQGIVFDIGPPQAIIYDKKENKTLFVGNDTMINEVKVKEIKRNKVILEYEDQKQELTF